MSMFITIEGPNGAGKTTFIKSLEENLSSKFHVFTTKEPSDTEFGQYAKNNEGLLTGKSYAYLIAADRCNHIDKFIEPAMSRYDIVLCDRYIESSLVLQHYDGVDLDFIWKLNENFFIPDLSIILLAECDVLAERLSQRKVLSSFEKKISRKEEVELYLQAHDYIKDKGFNSIVFNNNEMGELLENVNITFEMVLDIKKRRDYE